MMGGHAAKLNMNGRPSKEDRKRNFKNLLKAVSPYKIEIFFAFFVLIIATVLSIVAPQLLRKLTDEIAENAFKKTIDMDYIFKLGVILAVMYFLVGASNFISGYIMATVTQKYAKDVRSQIIAKINRMPLRYFDSNQYGDTLSILTNDVDTVSQSIQQSAGMLAYSVFMIIGVLLAMFITSWPMALTVLSILPLMLFMIIFMSLFAVPQFRKRQIILGDLNGKVEENFSGLLVIKAFNAEKKKQDEFDVSNKKMCHAMIMAQTIAGTMMPLMSFTSYFAYAAVCVVGGLLMTKNGSVSFGTITAFLIYVNLFQNPMTQIAQAASNVQMGAASSSRVYNFLNEEELYNETDKKRYFDLDNVKGDIEFKNVHFGYSNDKIIIPNFSASVKEGMKVAIVGPTGAGKTTMVNLLMRFYELLDGDITIDGVSIKDMSRDEIHDIFGMVLQDTWLFEGSIRDNIMFNRTGLSDDELIEICKETGLWHYINTLPGKLDYVIENDDSLSGGQKQLLTIARAMANNAPLLILDEATSNVDTRTEELIQKAMDKLMENRTSFVIAHRLSTIKNSDMILVMKDGNIIEQGNHKELIEKNGFYANLYNSQFVNND